MEKSKLFNWKRNKIFRRKKLLRSKSVRKTEQYKHDKIIRDPEGFGNNHILPEICFFVHI